MRNEPVHQYPGSIPTVAVRAMAALAVILYCLMPLNGQSYLEHLESYTKRDTTRVDLLTLAAHELWNVSPLRTDSLGREALALAQELDYPYGISRAYYHIAIGQWMLGNYPEAFEKASEQLRIAEQYGFEDEETEAYSMMALITLDQGLVEEALNYHRIVLQKRIESNDSSGIATSLNNLGAVFWKQDSMQKAMNLFQQSYDIRKTLGDKRGMRECLSNIAYILSLMNRPEEALPVLRKCLAVATEMNDPTGVISTKESLGEVYQQLDHLDSAEVVLLEALSMARELQINKRIIEVLRELKDVYELQGNYTLAYQYADEYWEMKHSIEGVQSAERISELQAQYQAEKNQREISELQQQNQVSRVWRNVFAAGLAFMLMLIALGYAFYRYRQRKNRELLEAKDRQTQELEKLNRLRSRFLANISHDLRTPLTLITGPAEELLRKTDDEQDAEQLSWILLQSRKLLKLINQLLDLSRLEAGKMELNYGLYDTVEFARMVVSQYASMALQKGLKLEVESHEETLYAYFDAERIEQVLGNLVHNALKFTNKGHVLVSVDKTTIASGETVAVTVEDTGTGINEHELVHIFDRFFQSSAGTEIDVDGTGIGLSLCKELVELHRGQLTATSKENEGSVFTFTLPLGSEHLPKNFILAKRNVGRPLEAPGETTGGQLSAARDLQSDKPLVLVVDDNADLLAFIGLHLKEDYRLVYATDGKKAVELALTEVPDLVVSDVMMPGMDGFALCQKLKSDISTSHIPVILLTARADDEHRIEGLELGADAYISKPFNMQELRLQVRNLIDLRDRLRLKYSEYYAKPIRSQPPPDFRNAFLNDLTSAIEEKIADPNLSVGVLATEVGMSKSQLNRKLKALTGNSPNQFIRKYRLQRAMELIEAGNRTIAEIAYDVGFSSPAYFSTSFKDEFGQSPSEVGKRTSLS